MTKTVDGAAILVVEDEPNVLRAVQRILEPTHQVFPAQGARDAETLLREREFDIAIVDIQLPDATGYEVNRTIHELRPDTDVILMTGSTSRQDQKIFQALEDDAFYFLFKPFDRRVLIALVERCLRIRRLQEENRKHLERLADDQAKARAIQRNLLPETPLEHAGWRMLAHFDPADEVSGDLYYAHPLVDGPDGPGSAEGSSDAPSLALLVADVVGHGLPAAMYAGMLRQALDAARRLDPHPRTVYDRLLDTLDFFANNSGASLIYGQLHTDGLVDYLNAGHPPALLRRAEAPDSVERLAATGPKLLSAPVIRHLPRDSDSARLQPGDLLLLYTDGLSEAESPDQGEWGIDRLEEAFLDACRRGESAEKVLEHFLRAFHAHCAGRPVGDDVTVVLIERR